MERTSMLCQGCLSPVGGGVGPDGFKERRGKKGGHEGPVRRETGM